MCVCLIVFWFMYCFNLVLCVIVFNQKDDKLIEIGFVTANQALIISLSNGTWRLS